MENILNNFPIISEYKFINSFYTLITYPVESKFRNENLRTEIIIEKEIPRVLLQLYLRSL